MPGERTKTENTPTLGAFGDLPLELSSFVGRERELRDVEELLAEIRLLTLTGPGGCGKTRLALRAASDLSGRFGGGTWPVELAPISDPALVPQTVAAVVGVREQPGRTLMQSISDRFGGKVVLLVLDNCEHLVDACARSAEELLRACPNLRIIATSREALRIAGERAWRVPPLSLPDPGLAATAERLRRYESVRLFVERTKAVVADFELDDQNAPAIAGVCRCLDGVPLAIELAAARTGVLSPEQSLSRLDDRFALLTAGGRTAPSRHRTLLATMDWSHELLSGKERTLFRRLSVFVGGFTLEAAEAVCSDGDVGEGEVLELLSHLLDKSLVVAQDERGARRYRLLESIRQYASGRLEESGEAKTVRRAHALYFLKFAEESEPGINGPERGPCLRRLEAEHDNLRAALGESLGGDVGLRLAGALWWFWFHRGYRDEGIGWLRSALGRTAPTRAKALCGAGWLSFVQGDREAGRSYLEESVTVAREADDDVSLVYALGFLAVLRAHQGDPAPALAEEGVRLFRSTGDRWGLGIALTNAGISTEALSEYALASPFFEESAAISRDLGDDWALSLPLRHLGILASRQQDYARAEALYKESLALCRDFGESWLISLCLEELAGVACWQGEYPRAARLWGAGETLREKLGAGLRSLYHAEYDRGVATARAGMGEGAFAASWKEGASLTPEEAVAYALGEEPDETALPAGLTGREAEVLRMVAAGLTNAQVAERLYLSPTTISAHLRTIYGKLGVNSRAAATRFAAGHGLL